MIIIGFLLHLLFLRYLSYNGITLNILLLLTIELSLIKGSNKGMMFGFFSGLAEDFFSFGLLGERALIRTIIGFFVGKLKGNFASDNIFFQFFLVFGIFIGHSYALVLIRIIFSYHSMTFNFILINAIVNGAAAPLMYYLLKKKYAR